jgi:hypothetical protein
MKEIHSGFSDFAGVHPLLPAPPAGVPLFSTTGNEFIADGAFPAYQQAFPARLQQNVIVDDFDSPAGQGAPPAGFLGNPQPAGLVRAVDHFGMMISEPFLGAGQRAGNHDSLLFSPDAGPLPFQEATKKYANPPPFLFSLKIIIGPGKLILPRFQKGAGIQLNQTVLASFFPGEAAFPAFCRVCMDRWRDLSG